MPMPKSSSKPRLRHGAGELGDALPHRDGHAHRPRGRVGHRHRVVEEDHHAVAGEALERALVRQDQPAHLRVVLAQHAHDLLRLGGLRERGEAAQVEEDHRDLAAVALERILGVAGHDQLGELGREEALAAARAARAGPPARRTRCSSVRFELAPARRAARLMRSSERTRASSSGWLIGLVRKSSAPASMPLTRSVRGIERGHHDDRQEPRRRVGAEPPADLVAAHLRHHHVEQHQVRLLGRDLLQGLRAGRRR